MTAMVVDTPFSSLAADDGFHFRSNCPVCGGGWQLEGKSLGREDAPKPVTEVRQVVTCSKCGLRGVLEVRFAVIRDLPESRWSR